MELKRIQYNELNARQKEIYNFQKLAGVLADYGFNCIKLADDWQGADFLAYHKDGKETLRIQLKSRIYVAKKYLNKNLYMAFRVEGEWYLVPHDELIRMVGEYTGWLKTASWREEGEYRAPRPSKALASALEPWRLRSGE